MTPAYSHRLITDCAELDPARNPELRKAWDDLAARMRNPLLGFDWFHACAMTIHADDALHIIVAYDGDDVKAIAPLVVAGSGGGSRLEILGTMKLYEPSGLLYYSDDALAYLLAVVTRSRLPFCMLRIPAADQSQAIVDHLGLRHGLRVTKDGAPAAYLELGHSWEDLVGGLSANRRYDFKRKKKRAEALGPVRVEDVRPSRADFPQLFEKAIAIEHASWKGRNGSSLQVNSALRGFFDMYLKTACDRGECRFFFLRIGDQAIAMQITIEADGACWVLKQGYVDDYARLSPGVQLTHYSLQSCIESGLKRFEFLGSEEGWQSSWPIDRHAFSTILLIPYSVAGFGELFRAAVSVVRRKSDSG